MGEVAATTAAFDQEFTKALTNILARKRAPPPEPVKKSKGEPEKQVERVSVWQQLEKLGDLMSLYFHRLPAFVGVPRLVEKAMELQRKGEFKHAWTKGFAVVENLGLLDPENNFPQMTESQRREFEVQARFGSSLCELGLLKSLDGALRHPHTVGSMLRILGNLRQAMQIVLPDERLYWLVFNGSVNIGTVALPLVQAGFAAEVVEFVLFAVVALESVLVLCAPRFLTWRLSLVAVVCQCYVDLQVPDHARSFLIRQQQKLKELQKLETLEPIPLTPETARIYQEAENKLSVLLFRTSHADLATPEAAVQLLQKELDTPGDQVRAVLEAMRDPSRRTMRHSPLPEAQQKLMSALDSVAWPQLGVFVQAEANNVKLAELEAAALKQREREEAIARGEAVEEEEPPPVPVEARPVSSKGKKGGKKDAPAAGKAATPPEAQEAQEAGPPKDLTQDVERVCKVIPMELHMMVLTCVFNYDAHEMYTKILEASKARLRLAQHLDPPKQVELMSGLIDIFEAAKKVEHTADSANLRHFVDVLAAQREEAAFAAFPDVITDTALMLWGLVKTLMNDLFQPKPEPVPLDPHDRELVTHLLLQLHVVFTKLDLDDGVLRGVLALRLVLLLEEGARLEEAAAVAAQALADVHRFRAHLSERSRGAPDEARRWISATKPLDEVETGVGESEMAYSAIHADLYSLYVRTELKLGKLEQEAQAQRRKHRAISTLEKRDQQVDIFGTKTPGEAKTLERNIVDAERTPPNAVEKERLLLKAADKNCYEKALLIMQMAAFQPVLMKRQHLLQEAESLLLYAESMEASLLKDVDATPKETSKGVKLPPKPRIITRTSTSLTVTNTTDTIPGFRKRGVKPVAFAVYAKPFGSGVGASLNSTEYEGSGNAAPLGARVEIRGLQPNETYILAVTMLDENGDIINGLGQPTREIPALLPLPLLLCWAYLATTALRLACHQVARRAAQAVLHHFTVTKVPAPLWNMNPFDSLVLNMTHVVAAPFPLLRALVQTLWVGAELAAATVEPIPHASKSYIHSQVSRLKMAKMIALAMEVSVFLKDEGLLNECVLRLYNAVGPLLTGTTRSARLGKVLASGYSAMTFLRGMRDERAVAASASITYELVQLYRGANETKAAAFFSAMDLPLLQTPPDKPPPEDPPPRPEDVGGDAPTVEKEPWNEDVLRLQEYLMSFPEVEEFESKVLQARFADAADLPARVLHTLLKEGAGAAYDLIKDYEIFSAPTIELKEMVMKFESLDAAAGKGKGGKEAKGGKKPKPKTPPKGGAAKTGEPRASSTEPPEATSRSEPRNPEVIQASPCEDGYELHLQQLVRVCKEALKKGEASQVKEWITAALDALKERLKCTPPQVGNDPSPQPPPPGAPGADPAVSGKSELPSGGEEEEEEELEELPEGEGEGLSREEVRLRAAELRRQTHAARTLQRYLPVMLAWRKHRMETRRIRDSTFLYRSQLLQIRATIEFEEQRAALAGGEHPLGAAAVVAATGVAPLMEDEDLDPDAPPPTPASLPVVRQMAQAVCLAARGGAVQQPGSWVQMVNAAKLLWNVVRYLLHRYPALGVFFGAPMCTAAAPINDLIRKFRNEGLWLGPIKLARGAVQLGLGEQVYEYARVERPPSRDSEVSFGSDLQVDSWFAKFSSWFDMEWVHKVVHLTMLVGSVCDKPFAALNVGSDFNDLTDGRFAENLAPLLLICARKSGMHVPRFQALRDQTLRDLTTFMEALMLARQTWKKKQKKALVVDRDGKAISTASLGSKKGSQADGRSRGSVQGHSAQRAGGVLSAEEKSQAALNQAEVAYNKAMEVLTYRGEKDLLSQAQNELGDMYAEHGSWHKAAVLWNDCVDGITGVYKCIKSCAQFGGPSPPEMLATFGRTKCLMAGVVFAKLSKYIYPDDLSVRLNSALASAGMLSAVFACSYTHPQRGLEMAEYVPLEVWEGVNIFSDPFQCNASDLSSSLHYVATVLLENHRAYLALPVLALLEYCSYHVARDARATVACRLLRARAQCQVGLLPAAARTMVNVMQGKRLPGVSNSNERTLLEPGQQPQVTAVPQYRSSELPGSENNQAVVQYLATAALPEQLAELYGEALRVRLKLCVADFFVTLAEVPNCWVETDRVSGEKLPTKSSMGQFEAVCLNHARDILVQVKEVVDPPPPEAAAAEAGEVPALPPRTLTAGDVTLLVHAHLLLGRVEQLAYQYSAGLTHTKSALQLLKGRGKVKAAQVASVYSAEGGSAALGSLMWLQARAQQLEILQEMKHHHQFKVVFAKAIKEASEVHEGWLVIRMQLLNAMVDADDGRTQEAMDQLHNLAHKCEAVGGQVHSAKGIMQATILAVLAELKRRCSLWEEAEELLNEARGILEEVVEMHALKEIMEEPKLQSIYVQGVSQLAKVLLLIAELRLINRDPATSYVLLRQAHHLTGFMRGTPQFHARLFLLLGRSLRLQPREFLSTQPLPYKAKEIDRALVQPEVALVKCLTVCALDGAHDWTVLHEAVLERAALAVEAVQDPAHDAEGGEFAKEHAIASCKAYLQDAARVATMRCVLFETPHALSASIAEAGLANMPAWLKAAVMESEQFQEALRGVSPGGNLPQGRLLVELFASMARKQNLRLLHADHLQAQVSKAHTYMKEVCAAYVKECCFEGVPGLLPAPDLAVAPPPLAPGTVLIQWQELEDVQVPQPPRHKKGTDKPLNPALVIPRAEFTVVATFVVVAEPGPVVGDIPAAPRVVCNARSMPLREVKAAQAAVKATSLEMEASEVATPLFPALPVKAPSKNAKEQVVHAVGRLFGTKEEGLVAPVLQKEVAHAVPKEKGSKPSTPMSMDADSGYTIHFMVQLESLLNTNSGVHLKDVSLANWLVQYAK